MKKKENIIGYTAGVFDLFHIGHLNILKNAKNNCDYLIVGVATDKLCESIKGIKPYIPFEERIEIVKSIKYVDKVIVQEKTDEINEWHKLKFQRIFKGSDWDGSEKWENLKVEFQKKGVEVIFFSYTKVISSSKLKKILEKNPSIE